MKKLFLFVAMAAVMSSCSKDEKEVVASGGLVPLSVSYANLTAVKTRAALTGGSLGVFQTVTTDGYFALSNIQYTWGTEWAAADPAKTIYLNDKNASFLAYYPYSVDANTGTVTLTSAKNIETNDLSYTMAASTAKNIAPTVNFTMDHAYSQIEFDITKDATYTGAGSVGNISIANAAILTSNTLDMLTKTYGAGTAGTVTYDAGIVMTTATPTVSKVLMVPVAGITGGITLTFVVDGVNLIATLPQTSLSALVFGSNYKVAVTLKGTKLVIGSVMVTNWEDAAVTGEIVPIP